MNEKHKIMKRFNKTYIVLLTLLVVLSSCAELDYKVDSGLEIDKPTSVIDAEQLNAYNVLKSYSGDLVLGANVTSDNISGTNPMSTLLETNFEQVTPLTEFNPSVVLSDDGVYDFTSIENYISKAEERGLSVFGDAIVSNSNQNDTYLNSLIAPYIFYTPLYPNFVIAGPLNDGTFTGWGVIGNVTVEDYLGNPSVKMVNGASESDGDATSLQSPTYRVDDGAKFEMTFYLLSNKVGEGRVVFSGLNNNEPELDWMGTGVASAKFKTKIGWNKIQFQTTDFDGSGQMSFKIELGYTPDVTYYMNIDGLSIINVNGSVENPDEIFLECEDAQQDGQWMEIQDDETASGGKTIVGIINGDIEADDTGSGNPADAINQDLQFTYTFNVNTSGTYRIWLRQKAYAANGGGDSFFISVDGADYYCPGWPAWGDDTNTTNWTWFKLFTDSGDKEGSSLFYLEEGEHTFSIKIREGGHYFDKLYLTMTTNVPTGFGSAAIAQKEITLDLTSEEKAKIIRENLKTWVSGVMTACKDNINAWDVVKEPMDDSNPQELKTGKNKVPASGEFYWQDFLGPKYAVDAFNFARESANQGDLLFISDYGLETNLVKCKGLIAYIDYIESQGATIDGISTQMHLTLSSDKDKIASMFQLLAATGKIIRISELKVSLDTSDPTSEMLQEQADMYKSVIDMYNSFVPASKQYGISLMGASDTNNEKYGLWNANYNRKPAYAGFADGLSGN